MPFVAHVLMFVAYVFGALAVGAALVRVGGADIGVGILAGALVFAGFAILHGAAAAIEAARGARAAVAALKTDLDRLRTLHERASGDIDAAFARLDRTDRALAEAAAQKTAGGPGEKAMIENLAERLGRTIDARFDELQRGAGMASKPHDRAVALVRDAIDEDRIELHLQPIVSLPQRRTMFYEGFTRLRDQSGRIIPPSEFMPAAESSGLSGEIDNILLFRCVQIVRRLTKQDRKIGIFCNISPASLRDESFFPHFLEFMRDNRDLAGSLIFEIGQDAYAGRSPNEARAMARLADLDFRFSMDKVTRLDVDLMDLERASIRFFKAPGKLLHHDFGQSGVRPKSNLTRDIAARDVAALFARYHIDLIAEKIEDEPTVIEILDLDIAFGQGHLFGQPRPIKEGLIEESLPPPDMMGRRSAH